MNSTKDIVDYLFTQNKGKWVSFEDELPTYYKVVEVETNEGEIYNMWRASDGEEDSMTIISTTSMHNRVFMLNELKKWRLFYGKKEKSST